MRLASRRSPTAGYARETGAALPRDDREGSDRRKYHVGWVRVLGNRRIDGRRLLAGINASQRPDRGARIHDPGPVEPRRDPGPVEPRRDRARWPDRLADRPRRATRRGRARTDRPVPVRRADYGKHRGRKPCVHRWDRMASATSRVVAVPPRSSVSTPEAVVAPIARMTLAASSSSPRCSSISAALQIAAIGFAIP